MKKDDEFYIGYANGIGQATKKIIVRFIGAAILLLLMGAFLFAFFQKPAVNSSFDFGNPTKISGVYHESPYPMLRVQLTKSEFKEVVLLGFGKSGANPYLDQAREREGDLNGKKLTIEGQLIYYNGKTLLEIDDSQKISVFEMGTTTVHKSMGKMQIEGEIIDPKCFFGVMKPGYGKIHRSCAARCISGGIPPVLVSSAQNGVESYFLLADLKGNAIHKDIVPYIGSPSRLTGEVKKIGDWQLLQIDVAQIEVLNKKSLVY